MTYLERAKALLSQGQTIRRQLHRQPEVGFDLKQTETLVKQTLDKWQIAYQMVGDSGAITGFLGPKEANKTLLLRADMDALPMKEQSHHDCVSDNENGHLCGHDMNTTILLMTLKMLKEDEDQLEGRIQFLFQPGEETLYGGQVVLDKGLFDLGMPDAGMAVHMWPNGESLGINIQKKEALASALNFRITIKGVGAHGAMPYNGVDPIFVASQIINATNGILARELPSNRGASLSMGSFVAPGGAVNVIPDTVVLEGTSRSLYPESARHMAKRIPEIVHHIGQAFLAQTSYEVLADVPSLVNTPQLSEEVYQVAKDLLKDEYTVSYVEPYLASEDFAHIASRLKESCYFFVSCPLPDGENKVYPVHHPLVQFNEEALVIGSATLAQASRHWLRERKG